jgi:hypothetical protein
MQLSGVDESEAIHYSEVHGYLARELMIQYNIELRLKYQ